MIPEAIKNKLTDKNYDEMFDSIVSIIKEIISENDNNTLENIFNESIILQK